MKARIDYNDVLFLSGIAAAIGGFVAGAVVVWVLGVVVILATLVFGTLRLFHRRRRAAERGAALRRARQDAERL
jgi:Flp pilus assembly protein TadB